ncbi:hypothetical protein C0989_006019 [Termitomyces sp. Mn162]|nr:hypothetical protein C0989_006019 [Termitomyces sp. Mn162]
MGSVAVFTGLVQQPVKQGNVMGVCLLRRILLSMHSKLIYRTSTIPVPAQSLISVSKSKTTAALKSPSTSILPATSLNLAAGAPTTPPSKLTGRLPALGYKNLGSKLHYILIMMLCSDTTDGTLGMPTDAVRALSVLK